MKTLHIFFAATLVASAVSCSGPQTKSDEQAAAESSTNQARPKPKPECYPGCMLDEDGKCTLEANEMDWSSVEKEEVKCDPVCCEKGNPRSPDQDGDGIFDESDKCPDQPEDYDNFQDKDGCPDVDNDGDKIKDADDVCPFDAEDVDGYQDDDGCPDP